MWCGKATYVESFCRISCHCCHDTSKSLKLQHNTVTANRSLLSPCRHLLSPWPKRHPFSWPSPMAAARGCSAGCLFRCPERPSSDVCERNRRAEHADLGHAQVPGHGRATHRLNGFRSTDSCGGASSARSSCTAWCRKRGMEQQRFGGAGLVRKRRRRAGVPGAIHNHGATRTFRGACSRDQ